MADEKTLKVPTVRFATSSPDIVTQINGNFGRWQLRTILLIFLCKIPSAWFMACIIYTAPTPQKGDYYCKPPKDFQMNGTDWVKMSHRKAEEEQHTDRRFRVGPCNIYEDRLEQNFAARYANFSNPFEEPRKAVNIIPCEKFEYNADYESLITQFDLVCSRQLLVSATQSFHALGALIGGLFALKALKHISPRRLMLIGMIFQIFCGNLTGLVNTFQLHIFFRLLTSLFCALMYTSGQIILADITGGQAKTIVTTLFELFWSIGLILLPGISIFLIAGLICMLPYHHRLLYWSFCIDSPRWLLRHQRIESALQQLLESAAFNNREIPLDLELQLENYAKELQSIEAPSYWSIWECKSERKYLYAIHCTWVGTTVLFNLMLIMLRTLGVEYIHVNTASMGFAEMIGVFIGLYFILYTRRRWLWAGYIMITAGLLAYFLWFIPDSIKQNRRTGMELIFWLIIKLANSASQSVHTACTGELVSVEKRPLLMLSVVTFSRIWLVPAPFIFVLSVIHKLIPVTIFATLAIVNGLLMCFLNKTFWNDDHPRIQRVPTLNTYRRNSAAALIKRNSTCSSLESGKDSELSSYDNPITISISDLWHLETVAVNRHPKRFTVQETEHL